MLEGFFAVGEFLKASLEAPHLHIVLRRLNRLEHAHRCQSVFELLVHIFSDVHGGGHESLRILQVHREALEITEELLREFLRDFGHAVPLSLSMEYVHPLTGTFDVRCTDDGAHTAPQRDENIPLLRGAVSRRERLIKLVEEVMVAELGGEGRAVHVSCCLLDCLASVTHKNLHGISVFLELLEVENTIDHVLIVSNGVVGKIAGMVIRADERDEFVQKSFVVTPVFLSCELCEEVPHMNVRPIHAENTPPFRSQILRNPRTVFYGRSQCMHKFYCGIPGASITSLNHTIAAVIFEMTTDNPPLPLLLSGGERAPAIFTPHELYRPFFVGSCSSTFGMQAVTIRTANDFLS